MKTHFFLFVGVLIIVASLLSSAGSSHASQAEMMKVEGASSSQLLRLRDAIHKAAYTPATSEADACSYVPIPTKFRVFKRMPEADPCVDKGTTVLADIEIQVLYLCKDGKSVGDYDFSMGRNGIEKRFEGDLKTPIGRYPLGKPYALSKFKVFIPVGYPTPEQKSAGYTGSEIGIHGPARAFRCAGFLNSAVNWTQGCIAVDSDVFIKEIGRFVEENKVKFVTISPFAPSSN